MRFKLILFMAAAMIPCGQIAAQELLDIDAYDQETIYIHYSIFGDGFVKNGQIIGLGAFGSNLAKEMAGSEYALAEMRKVRKYKLAGTITNLVATTFSVTAIVLAFRDDDNLTFEITSLAIGGLCGLLAQGFNRSAMAAMNRAVWLYNRDVTTGQLRILDLRFSTDIIFSVNPCFIHGYR